MNEPSWFYIKAFQEGETVQWHSHENRWHDEENITGILVSQQEGRKLRIKPKHKVKATRDLNRNPPISHRYLVNVDGQFRLDHFAPVNAEGHYNVSDLMIDYDKQECTVAFDDGTVIQIPIEDIRKYTAEEILAQFGGKRITFDEMPHVGVEAEWIIIKEIRSNGDLRCEDSTGHRGHMWTVEGFNKREWKLYQDPDPVPADLVMGGDPEDRMNAINWLLQKAREERES